MKSEFLNDLKTRRSQRLSCDSVCRKVNEGPIGPKEWCVWFDRLRFVRAEILSGLAANAADDRLMKGQGWNARLLLVPVFFISLGCLSACGNIQFEQTGGSVASGPTPSVGLVTGTAGISSGGVVASGESIRLEAKASFAASEEQELSSESIKAKIHLRAGGSQ
jgi:hypothetical protein